MGEVDIAEEFSGIEGLAVFEAASPEAGEGLRITAQRAWSQNLEEVRGLATECQERYNRHWRLEKPGFRSPLEARQAYTLQEAAWVANRCPGNSSRRGMRPVSPSIRKTAHADCRPSASDATETYSNPVARWKAYEKRTKPLEAGLNYLRRTTHEGS